MNTFKQSLSIWGISSVALISGPIGGMSTEHLRMFRAHGLDVHSGMPDQAVVIDVIDGLLALREIGRASCRERVSKQV